MTLAVSVSLFSSGSEMRGVFIEQCSAFEKPAMEEFSSLPILVTLTQESEKPGCNRPMVRHTSQNGDQCYRAIHYIYNHCAKSTLNHKQ